MLNRRRVGRYRYLMDVRTLYVVFYVLAAALPMAGLIYGVRQAHYTLGQSRRRGGATLGDISVLFGPNPPEQVAAVKSQWVALTLVGAGLLLGAWASIGSLFL